MGRGRDRQRGRDQESPSPAQTTATKIRSLTSFEKFPADDLVRCAEEIGRYLQQIRLKTNQIRKFLDEMNGIKARGKDHFDADDVILLKPKLAYAAGRSDEVRPLMDVLTPCVEKVGNWKDFLRLHKFMESIIAYHRFYGGE